MRWHRLCSGATAVLLPSILGGCAAVGVVVGSGVWGVVDVAHINREWAPAPGPETVRADRERPLTVDADTVGGSSLRIGLPLRIQPASIGDFGRCTVRAAWISHSLLDSIGDVRDDDPTHLRAVVDDSLFFAIDSLTVETDGGQRLRARFDIPRGFRGGARNQIDELDAWLLVEIWLKSDLDPLQECDSVAPPPPPDTDQLLIAFGSARPLSGVGAGGGAFVIGIVALLGLMTLGGG